MRSFFLRLVCAALTVLCCWGASSVGLAAEANRGNPNASLSRSPASILDLQPYRRTDSLRIKDTAGVEGTALLTNLNPAINGWYLLELRWPNALVETYHLENPSPKSQTVRLDANHPDGLVIGGGQAPYACDLWGTTSQNGLRAARRLGAPYASLCGGRLYLRNHTPGRGTSLERVTDFLRENVPAGDRIVGLVRDAYFPHLYEQRAETEPTRGAPGIAAQHPSGHHPADASLNPSDTSHTVKPLQLGIASVAASEGGMALGRWYAARDTPGVYVSVIQVNAIAPEVLRSYATLVSPVEPVESAALVYLAAFDLGQLGLKYALGTDHPKVGWSDHMLPQMKNTALPGPDGIGSSAPVVSTGLVNPRDANATVATFTAGFKRIHGAFKYGELASRNGGSHYGFIEEGVVFSKLQPGLATLYVLEDGTVDMKTWADADERLLPHIRYARQNGVPIISGLDVPTQVPVPGALVSRWGEGNWSGSADRKLRTLRAGAGLQDTPGGRFLVYAFFWSATPSAMARVFQAYGCRYAMLLDMNALEHTYLAVYRRERGGVHAEHLIQEMQSIDASVDGRSCLRFLECADNRDFFYLIRKEGR